MSGPLDGFRIIDVCRAAPGQWGTAMLADYGAEVISVVEPGYAERRSEGGSINADLVKLNRRNKRSIGLNLRDAKAREVLLKLAKTADGMLESNRPGVVKRLGIDYEAVSAVNPAIVYCSLSGFGQYGPYRDIPNHDLSFQGVAGEIPQDLDGKPYVPAFNQADLNAACFGAMALLTGLLGRSKNGLGQYIDVSFTDVSISIPPGGGMNDEMLKGAYPAYNVYETKDGRYLSLSTREPWYWEKLCNFLGRPDYLPHFRPSPAVKDEMFATFRGFFKQKTLAEWVPLLMEADLQFGPVNTTVEQLRDDPHLKAREMILELSHPSSDAKIYEPGFALKFSKTPAEVRHGPTIMGSDNDAILKELGYSDSDIAALHETKAVG